MKQIWIIFVFAIAATAGNLTRKKRDAEEDREDRDLKLLAVGNGELHEETHDLQKRIGFQAVVAAGTVVAALAAALQYIGDYNRKIAIGITNKGPYKWEGLDVYRESGVVDTVVDFDIPVGKALIFKARKKNLVATGAVGVIALYIPEDDKTIYVLYSVPFDTNLYSNYWNVQVRAGKKYPDDDIYKSLFEDALLGDHKVHAVNVGEGYSCRGVMSDSTQGEMKVDIEKKLLGDVADVILSLPDTLRKIGKYSRKIAIAIVNDGPYEWKTLPPYFYSGTSDSELPDTVLGGQAFLFTARKTSYSARGAVGVIALYSPTDKKTILILYSVPFSQGLYSNRWNVQVIDGKGKPNSSHYTTLYSVSIEGDGIKSPPKKLDDDYSCSVIMSTSAEATMEVRIEKKRYNVGK